MVLIHQYFIPFHAISYTYDYDVIFYQQSLFDILLSVSKCIKLNQNKVSNFDRLKRVSKFRQGKQTNRQTKSYTLPKLVDSKLHTDTVTSLASVALLIQVHSIWSKNFNNLGFIL